MLTSEKEYKCVTPLVCVEETDREIILEAEMPGITKEQIQLEMTGDELCLVGTRKAEDVPKEYSYTWRERSPIEYRRTFVIGSEVDRNKITAKYDNGILKVILPKSERILPKKIQLQ